MYYDRNKLMLSIFWIILGAVLVVLSFAEVLDSSFYAGMGGAFLAVGVMQVIRQLRYRKDPEYKEKIDIEAGDERNKYLRGLSWSWAGYISVLTGAIGTIVAKLMGQETVMMVLSSCVCFIMCVYWISYLILKRKY